MNKELYVSSTPHETKVALVEDDQLAEVFFERENEYTLAGSIYKGRVTRVLPGMQSAFVDIGLERDAFLYVSDFLELPSEDEEEGEFGQIPAPRTAVDVGKSQPVQEARTLERTSPVPETEVEEESETAIDFAPSGNGDSSAEELEASPSGDRDSEEGSRRWRGRRRRRGGRRGRADDRDDQPETKTETSGEAETNASRPDSRPHSAFAPPVEYAPMILPGESISKYRNQAQSVAGEPATQGADTGYDQMPTELHRAENAFAETEETKDEGDDEERRDLESAAAVPSEVPHSTPEAQLPETPAELLAASPQNEEEDVVEDEAEVEIHTGPLPADGGYLEHASQPEATRLD